MSKVNLEEIEDLNLTKIEKVGKKPTKPTKPSTIDKVKVQRTTYWKSTAADKDFDLINDILKKVPKDVDPSDIKVWIEQRSSYSSGMNKEVHFGIIREIPNPKYTEALERYKQESDAYQAKITEWEKTKADYDNRLELRKKYNDLVKAQSVKSGLKDKLAKISKKISAGL